MIAELFIALGYKDNMKLKIWIKQGKADKILLKNLTFI